MKAIFLILVRLLFTCSCYAQTNAPYVYTDFGIGRGTFTSYKAGLNWFFGGHHSVGVNYHRHWRDGLLVPSDFDRSGIFGNGIPNDKMLFGSATYGRIIQMTDIARLNLKGGFAAGIYRQPAHFRPTNGNGFFALTSSNYTYTTNEEPMLGILINPVAEFTFHHSFGMALGATGMYSAVLSFISIDLTLIAGSLREPLQDADYE